ncbi:MAG: putative Hybrid histidine kinase [Fibrobacteres bacterium]|nr:putative Hybrid histidine kinase [Fibrobacterota bacterium]
MSFTSLPAAARPIFRWGAPASSDPRRARRIVLSNQMAVMAAVAFAGYSVLYPAFSVPLMGLMTLPAAAGFACVPILNRLGRIRFSRILFILIADGFILGAGLGLGTSTGVHLFLLPCAWLALILFDWEDWEERASMMAGVALASILLVALEALGPAHGALYALNPRQEKMLHFLAVIAAQSFQIMVVLHFFLGNRLTETALAEAGEAAKTADKAKGRFLANMSHEIRTPLNGILGMSNLLLKSEMRDDQKDLVQSIQSSGLDLMAIISEILDLSKIEAGKMRLEHAPFNLGKVVESTLRPFENEARRKRLRLAVDSAADLPGVLVGDAMRLKQVLNNLIGNGLKFTHGGGVMLRIRKGAAPQAVPGRAPLICPIDFEVEDTGIGISPDAQARIFQSFPQASQSGDSSYGGTGLGLFISRQMVEMMGGAMGFRARTGGGTVFHFTIPFAFPGEDATEPERMDGTEPRPAPGAALSRLLIVEDHPLNQKVLNGFLAQFGFRADTAPSGKEAVKAFARKPYDLVFMDCHMPGMDGFECTRALRADAAGGKPFAVIGVTADAMQGIREKCLEAGMDDVITKPILTEDLQRVLTRWLGMPGHRPDPVASDPPASAWVDVRHLREMDEWIRIYDPGFWERAQDQFRTSAGNLISSLRQSLESGRTAEAAESAHALKGLCLMMGLSRMGDLCKSLEDPGLQGGPMGWIGILGDLQTFLEPSLEEMRRQVGKT